MWPVNHMQKIIWPRTLVTLDHPDLNQALYKANIAGITDMYQLELPKIKWLISKNIINIKMAKMIKLNLLLTECQENWLQMFLELSSTALISEADCNYFPTFPSGNELNFNFDFSVRQMMSECKSAMSVSV